MAHPALLEKSRWHRCSWADVLRIGDPAFHPVGLQPLLCKQEVWCRSNFVMLWIASGVALQAWGRSGGKQAARHVALSCSKSRHLLWDIRHRLLRQRLEETHELAQFIVRE